MHPNTTTRTHRVAASVAIIAALIAVSPAHAQTQAAPREALERTALATLSGIWASPQSESWYGAYGTREFRFDEGRWSLRFTLALDPAMQAKVFEFRTGGPYYIAQVSKTVPGAFDAVFMEDTKHVTLMTRDPKLAQAFGFAACGLEPDVEKDISIQGCAGWKPVAKCREDHDLLALGPGGQLHFGVRPRDNDMCSADRRPKALLQPVVRRSS